MDETPGWRPPWPNTAESQSGTTVIMPPVEPLYQSWQSVDTVGREPPPYTSERRAGVNSEIYQVHIPATSAQKSEPGKRPWWMRLFLDAVVVPFVQGFMLNLGIHYMRYWRNSGGLVGVFRRRAALQKPK